MKRLIFPVVACSLLLTVSSRADLTVDCVTEMQAQPEQMTLKLGSGRMRVESTQGTVLLWPKEQKVAMWQPGSTEAMIMTLPGSGAPDSTTPEEDPKIERTGKKETISGYACDQVILTMKDGTKSEIWVSKDAPDMSEFMPIVEGLNLPKQSGKMGLDWWKKIGHNSDLRTFPVRQLTFDGEGKVAEKMTVTKFSKDALPATAFDIPAGYTKNDMSAMGAAMGAPAARSKSSPTDELLKLTQEIQKSGKPPTPEQIEKLQSLSQGMQ